MRSSYIDEQTLARLKRHCRGRCADAWLPFAVADATGMRIGDVLKIRPQDVKPDGIEFVAEKTGKPGFARVTPAMRRRLWRTANEYWVFPSPFGGGEKHLTRQAAWARLKVAARRAGVEVDGVSPHSLRKAYAVELYKKAGMAAVQTALQHSSMEQTERYALSDWLTGAGADKPLRRGDLGVLVRMCTDAVLTALERREAHAETKADSAGNG